MEAIIEGKYQEVLMQKKPNHFELAYGFVKKGTDLTTTLKIKTKKELLFQSTCGCTISKALKEPEGYKIDIKYNSDLVGEFSKVVKIVKGREKIGEINLTGIVLK